MGLVSKREKLTVAPDPGELYAVRTLERALHLNRASPTAQNQGCFTKLCFGTKSRISLRFCCLIAAAPSSVLFGTSLAIKSFL